MKKILLMTAIVTLLSSGMIFAQEEEEELSSQENTQAVSSQKEEEKKSSASSLRIDKDANYSETDSVMIQVEDNYADLHPKASSVDITLEWFPLTNEVRFTYTCNNSSYDKGEAMNVSIAVFEDFSAANKYKHYRYVEKDSEKFFKDSGLRRASYTSKVIFTK